MKVRTAEEIREFMIPGYKAYIIPPGGVVHSKGGTRLDIDHAQAQEVEVETLAALYADPDRFGTPVFNAVFDISRRAVYYERLPDERPWTKALDAVWERLDELGDAEGGTPAPPGLDDLEDDLLDVGEAWGGEDAGLVGARSALV